MLTAVPAMKKHYRERGQEGGAILGGSGRPL